MRMKFALLNILLLGSISLWAQQTSVFTEAYRAFVRGDELFKDGLLAPAQIEFQKTLDLLLPVQDAEAVMLTTQARLQLAKCSVRLGAKDGEATTLQLIRSLHPDPAYQQALVDLGNFYFNNKRYEDALNYYARIPSGTLPKAQMDQVQFRQGYATFVKKQYTTAKSFFLEMASQANSEYAAPANYYLGLCYFFEADYDKAYQSFQRIENHADYKNELPYIQAQILFAQRKFDELIQKTASLVNDTRTANLKEIRQLVGQSYFEKGDYPNALPHLEFYASNASKMREEELYQVGYAQYQMKKYQDAIRNFKPLSIANTSIGQNAMFYLANCYLQLGDKNSALNALATAKRLDYDPILQEDARFNYAKLALELNQPREAANELQVFTPQSKYYSEAQGLLSQALLGYRDYQQALDILEDIMKTNQSPQLKATYQQLSLSRGLQLIQQNDLENARKQLQAAIDNPLNAQNTAVALFWMADIANRREDYEESIRYIDKFLVAAKSLTNLPEESNVLTANYLQAYNLLRTNSYDRSRSLFQATVDGISRARNSIKNPEITNSILGDATMRLGDGYFRENLYANALKYYNEAISKRYNGYDYALFQKAIIEGLQGRKTEEINALKNLVASFPNSEYADDALFRLGDTYQEVGNLAEAMEPLKTLVSKYRSKSPLINQALLKLGLIAYNQGNYEGAASYYKQVFSNNPEPGEASQALSALEEIYIGDLGRPGEYTAFLETVPGYKVDNFVRDSLNYKVAIVQFENQEFKRAAESFSNYLRTFPKGSYVVPATYNRAECYSNLKEYSKALPDYDAVIKQGPSKYFIKALEKAALIAYHDAQDFQKAFNYYVELERNASSEDKLFEAQIGAMRCAYRTNNRQALANYSSKVANNSNASPEQVATANFYIGKQAFDVQDFNTAMTAFQKVIKNSDNELTAEARYLIASIHFQRRELDKVKTICMEANRLSSAYPNWVAKSFLLLADAMVETKDLYDAQAVLESLIENFDGDKELVEIAKSKLAQVKRQIEQTSILNKSGSGN